jgi:ATP-binding cassette subfamily B protein
MLKYGWLYIPGAFFLYLSARITNLGPTALGDAVNMLEAGMPFNQILRQAGIIVLIAVSVFVFSLVWRLFIIMNARRMEVFFREELFVKLQALPPAYFARRRSGDMMAYAVNDVNAARQVFGPALAQSVNGICTGVIAVISMISRSGLKMTLLALIPLPLAVYMILRLGSAIEKRSRASQDLFAKLSGFINEAIMGMKIIKSFARESEWLDNYTALSDDMRRANVKLNNTSAWLNPVSTAAFGISYAVVLILGGNRVLSGRMDLGGLVALLGYILIIQQPINMFGRIINMVQRGSASYRRLMSVCNEVSIPESDRKSGGAPVHGGIEARNLTFKYDGASNTRPALYNVSFKIEEGGFLGITGGVGGGKSTLAALLMKHYTPPEGQLFIGGRDVTQLSAFDIRENAGYVPQDGFLFSASIRDNILFYAPGKTEADMLKAAETACIRHELEAFPKGFDTEVGERGARLSGGQKQRIALARALVKEPMTLILDDTLSAVDNITEQIISSNLERELRGRTRVIISHRLSALKNADLILFLDEGRVLERGTHEELIALGGRYHDMWLKQSEENA